MTDHDDTMALLACIDIVITVDTSVGRLAAKMGKPVWILLAHVSVWPWLLERENSPWYLTTRLFRQTSPSRWPEVFQRVTAALGN